MSKSERRKKLEESLKTINKKNKGLVQFAETREDCNKIPYGIPQLDEFVGGGHQEGTFTVIYGGETVGKSTLTLQAIAHAQKQDKFCCYIDLEHSFSKKRAIELGINLDELVLVEQCQTAEQALGVIRKLCQDKVIDMIVVDSVQAMSPLNEQSNKGKQRELEEKEIAELARTLSKFFKVVAPDVFRAKASVIMIGQVRIGGIGTFFTRATMSGGEAIKHWASTRIFMRRGQNADAPVEKYKEYITDPDGKEHYRTKNKVIGFDCVLKLEKTRSSDSALQNSEIHLPFYYKTGFKPLILQEEISNIKLGSKILDIKNQQNKVIDIGKLEIKPKKKRRRPKKNG